jgi:hypothetical protein
MSSCLGHLQCDSVDCDYLTCTHHTLLVNKIVCDGISSFTREVRSEPPKGSIVCKVCKVSIKEFCNRLWVYYMLAKSHITCVYVHLGSCGHPMKIGSYWDSSERTQSLLGEQLE